MVVPSGRRNFFGALKSSVRNQPPTLTALAVGLYSSIASTCGGSVCVNASLIKTGGIGVGAGPPSPGDPFSVALGRQLTLLLHVASGAVSLTITSEKPKPSVIGYQESS